MTSKFHEMLAKKRDLKPSEKHAKMGVLKDLKDSLADSLSDKMSAGPIKKVSVMSDSPEGLSAGLDKARQMTNSDQDQMMSEGGLALSGPMDGSESYNGDSPGPEKDDDGFNYPNDKEAYSTGMSMDNNNKSKQDSDEPEHVMYDGSSDQEMGPGFYEGGEMGPNEVTPDEVTFSGNPDDDGFMHPDSDESVHGDSYSEGGEVANQMAEAADSVQDERDETVGDQGDNRDDEHADNVQKLQARIDHLMRLKKQMERQ